MYRLMELLPNTKDSTQRLGLVAREQMIQALVCAIENPCRMGASSKCPEYAALAHTAVRAPAFKCENSCRKELLRTKVIA
jgi:hypothetical protein